MSVVVLEVVALGLKDVEAVILELPAAAAPKDDIGYGVGGEGKVGGEAVAKEPFTGRFMRDGEFAPVDRQGIVAIS